VTQVSPGAKLSVKVRSPRRRVTVSLHRAGISGHLGKTVAKRTLRNGTFRVPTKVEGIYALRLSVAGKRYWSWLVVGKNVCFQFGKTSRLQLSTTTVVAGGSLPYQIVNTSDGCVSAGYPYTFQQLQPDGSWIAAPSGQPFLLPGFWIGSGGTFAKTARIPPTFSAGTYRLVDTVFGDGEIPLTADFQVVAP